MIQKVVYLYGIIHATSSDLIEIWYRVYNANAVRLFGAPAKGCS